jgi:hypothetical protein
MRRVPKRWVGEDRSLPCDEITDHHHQYGNRHDHAEHGGDARGQVMVVPPLSQRPYHRTPDLDLARALRANYSIAAYSPQ